MASSMASSVSKVECQSNWKFCSLHRMTLILGGGTALSVVAYAIYRYYRNRTIVELVKDEGFVDATNKAEEVQEQKVLMLGLDGAGKSSILFGLTGNSGPVVTQPTEGFNVVCLKTGKVPMSIWEVGGSSAMRKYWANFIQDTQILMYVVDSADESRLSEAYNELHTILGDERLQSIPVIIVVNKQDVSGAMTSDHVLTALAMDRANRCQMHVDCVLTQSPPSAHFVGIRELHGLLEHLAKLRIENKLT